MNARKIASKAVFIILFLITTAVLLTTQGNNSDQQLVKKSYAYETTCPPEMNEQECLRYLQEQAKKLSDEKNALGGKISSEEFAQLSLYQKIKYYNSQIASTEATIAALELDIEKNNLEIKIITREITHTEENINTASQEINKLEGSIRKRVALSYKFGTRSPLEVIFNAQELEETVKKIAYMKETKERDKELLSGMGEKRSELEKEKIALAQQKVEVQKRRDEVEAAKSELYQQQVELGGQRYEQQLLLNESKRREDEYLARLNTLKAEEDAITSKITKLILELYQTGQLPANTPVEAGDIIGYQGHTGLSYGSHLHFEYRVNGVIKNPFSADCLTGGYGTYVGNGSCRNPLDGGFVTQFPHYSSPAVDMVSYTSGVQTGEMYYTDGVSCVYGSVPAGWYGMRGEGAPIRAIKSGMVSRVFTDVCGGRALIVDHGNGEASLYLHLR